MILQILQELANQYGLPVGTAERLHEQYQTADGVHEEEEMRYAAAWEAYHAALDGDDDMATLARVYGQHCEIPISQLINAQGVFIF